MQGLNDFEQAVLDKLLAGEHPVLAIFRRQAERGRLLTRENTGVGFYCELDVGTDAPVVQQDFQIGDVHADVEGLTHGAGFVLFAREGRLNLLEGFSYDEVWPEQVRSFSLRYLDSERKATLTKLEIEEQ